MRKIIYVSLFGFILFGASGCSSLAKMKTVNKVDNVQSNQSMVSIVRPRIFLGDGVDFEVWDGNKFIGTLKAGSMIQYLTLPGEHDFMIDPTQGGKWAYTNLNLEAGKTYYIKPNTVPFVGLNLGVALPDDARISKWNEGLTPLAIDEVKSKPVPKKNIDEAQAYLKKYKMQNAH
ncbi:hypothetical protein [Pseudocolwellia agarivorans]|uniref:hypothetical protein n=1 Tax=Pseudocolwellia agarivorans TaxID=1911682 RepID=UPI0009851C51|nr:hypothetical protein [Pseudocolwellia agarivorans]